MTVGKIAVIGANGMLGYATSEFFKSNKYSVASFTRSQFDISTGDMAVLERLCQDAEVVINCAGVIKQKITHYTIEETLKVNSIFPVNLAKLCNKLGIMCFHITTDCVFSGKRGSYVESDYYDPVDIYGVSKAAGDTPDCMTLRTSIIGEEKFHADSLLSWVKSRRGTIINGFTNHYWNGVTTLYLAELIEQIIKKHLYSPGIFHLYTQPVVNKYQLVSFINEVYELGITVNKFETDSLIDRSLSSAKSLSEQLVTKDLLTQIFELKAFFDKLRESADGNMN